MIPNFSKCPVKPQAVAEAYLSGTLTPEQEADFETHYLACEACVAILENTAGYVDAMRDAARTLRLQSRRTATGN